MSRQNASHGQTDAAGSSRTRPEDAGASHADTVSGEPAQRGAPAERRPDDKPGGRHDPERAAKEGSSEHARKSGRWGAEEASYGRPYGERPNPGQGGRANPKGPEFEQGGRYPGAQEAGEARAADKETGATPKPGEGRRQRG